MGSVQSMRRSALFLAHLAEAAERHGERPIEAVEGDLCESAIKQGMGAYDLDREATIGLLLQGDAHEMAAAALPTRLRVQARDLLLAATQLQDAEEQADAVDAALSDTLRELSTQSWYDTSYREFCASRALDGAPTADG